MVRIRKEIVRMSDFDVGLVFGGNVDGTVERKGVAVN